MKILPFCIVIMDGFFNRGSSMPSSTENPYFFKMFSAFCAKLLIAFELAKGFPEFIFLATWYRSWTVFILEMMDSHWRSRSCDGGSAHRSKS